MLDSFIEEENDKSREKEEMTTIKCSAGESDGGHQWQRSSDKTTLKPSRTVVKLKLA
jgi:hypothetical protein